MQNHEDKLAWCPLFSITEDEKTAFLDKINNGKTGKNADVVDTLKKAMKLLDLQMTNYMQNGKINPVSGIFLMKNNLGYTDKQEVIVTLKKTLDGDMTRSPEELRRMYVEQVAENGLPAPALPEDPDVYGE